MSALLEIWALIAGGIEDLFRRLGTWLGIEPYEDERNP